MSDYIAKWHRELGIFSRIKPLIIVEGNVLDVYQYPVEGASLKGASYGFRSTSTTTLPTWDIRQSVSTIV